MSVCCWLVLLHGNFSCAQAESAVDLGLRYRDLDLISISSVIDTVFEASIDISSISIPALHLDDISVKSLSGFSSHDTRLPHPCPLTTSTQ